MYPMERQAVYASARIVETYAIGADDPVHSIKWREEDPLH